MMMVAERCQQQGIQFAAVRCPKLRASEFWFLFINILPGQEIAGGWQVENKSPEETTFCYFWSVSKRRGAQRLGFCPPKSLACQIDWFLWTQNQMVCDFHLRQISRKFKHQWVEGRVSRYHRMFQKTALDVWVKVWCKNPHDFVNF